MKTTANKTERLHSLDSLRAIMMLLGLVLHSAITYSITDHGEVWSLKDPGTTNYFYDYIVYLIHLFRMPVFFVMAGFFGALLFYERRPVRMIKNRMSRIVFPFIVFLFLLWPIILFAFNYTSAVFSGNDNAFSVALARFSTIGDLLPTTTFHLWFLYYLIFITFATLVLGLLFNKLPAVTSKITQSFNRIIQKPILRVLVFAIFTFLIFLFLKTPTVEFSIALKPHFNTFIYFFFFYIVGWVLFKSKHLLDTLKQYDWIFTILGLIVATVQFVLYKTLSSEIMMPINSIIIWLFIFGITGLFLRYTSKHSKKMRYISDSSYWVYLIHLPLTAFIPGLIAEWPIPAFIKFLIILIVTTIICFVTYHYFVRATFIGKFLNGRKYPI